MSIKGKVSKVLMVVSIWSTVKMLASLVTAGHRAIEIQSKYLRLMSAFVYMNIVSEHPNFFSDKSLNACEFEGLEELEMDIITIEEVILSMWPKKNNGNSQTNGLFVNNVRSKGTLFGYSDEELFTIFRSIANFKSTVGEK